MPSLQFLGTGSAFTVGDGNWQSNMLLTASTGKHLLIDCGSDARFSLFEVGKTAKDLDGVYISHLHADHVGGLEWLAFSTYFGHEKKRLKLYCEESLVQPLWEHVLQGGLSSIQGVDATLATYFDIYPLSSSDSYSWENISFQLFQTVHVVSKYHIIPSFGLVFEIGNKKIFLTTDAQHSPSQIDEMYEEADLIFHDCETTTKKSGIHAHYSELQQLPEHIKKKMWLYHYHPGKLPPAEADGFLGFIKKGQLFELG